MAEEQDKKDDEKLEFDSAGQAIGYISLDQARVLAMEHARDNRDFYGRRYASRELVWEVSSQEESEDYYDIRLSYRPTEGFRGEPGHEQFTIDKTGPIRLRQVLSQPQPSRRTAYVIGLAIVLAATVATVGGLFASGALTTNNAPTTLTTSVSITPDAPARLESPAGDVVVNVKPGAVDNPVALIYQPVPADKGNAQRHPGAGGQVACKRDGPQGSRECT